MNLVTIFLLFLIVIIIIWLLLKSPDNKNSPYDISSNTDPVKPSDDTIVNTNVIYVDRIKNRDILSESESRLLVPIKGTFQEANYISSKTGRFKMYKPPQTKSFLVRIKDSTDYSEELFWDLDKQEKEQFSVRNYEYQSEYINYCFEIDSLDEMVERLGEKRRNKLWPYNFDLFEILEDFEDDFDFEVPVKYLTHEECALYKNEFIEPLDYEEHEIELWDQLKVFRLQNICRENNISTTKKNKASLIESLKETDIEFASEIKFPYRLTENLKAALQPIISLYVSELKNNIDRFHPLQIPIIWESAFEVMNADIVVTAIEKVSESQYWKENLREVSSIDYVLMRVN
ncbi:MAG: hypothetical protein ACI8Q1_003041 [Parvicella sp.]|jgi:hypothetical protein